MFVITEADAAAIRAVFNGEGELSAAVEFRRRFPGIIDNAKARACARTIAGWAVGEIGDAPGDLPIKRRRGRPPGKLNSSMPSQQQAPKKVRKAYTTIQEPVQWWPDGWTPSA